MFFGDMPYQSSNEIYYRNGFGNKSIVLMTVIMESHRIAIIRINAGGSNNGSAKITAYILCDNFWITEIGFGIDVKTILLITVNRSFDYFERIPDKGMQFIQKSSLERKPKKFIVEMIFGTPTSGVADTAFRNEAMYVRIPFKIPSESMKDTDEPGSKAFGFIILIKTVKDNATDSREKTVK